MNAASPARTRARVDVAPTLPSCSSSSISKAFLFVAISLNFTVDRLVAMIVF
jgi:hypothetical protein